MGDLNIDNHKLMYHPERVSEWVKKGDCYPIYIEIGLTNACNHRCVFCALDYLEYKGGFIDSKVLILNLKDMAEHGVKSIMFAGEGEPFLHKDIELFIQTAKKNKIDVSITTNGVLFNKIKIKECLPNLSWIRFSVDSGSPENYEKIHRTKKDDFYKVINNLKDAVKFRNENNFKTTIGVQFLMIPKNRGEELKLAQILKDIGVDNLQVKPYSHHPKSKNDFIINPKDYKDIEKNLKKYNSEKFQVIFRKNTVERLNEGITYTKCYGLPFFSLIDAKGNIIPCNLFYNQPEFIYGNLNNQKFSDIWKGEKRKQIIAKLKGDKISQCRKGCRLDVINKYLNRIKNPLFFDNFI